MRFHRAGHDAAHADARPLLFVISRNLMKDHWKRARRSPISSDAIEADSDAIASDHPAADRGVIARQDLVAAARVIRDLPPRCRDAFLLHRFEELTYREIAERLGISVSMVEKHLAEALRRLKSARSD